ncbi:MAG: hypothetical protein VX464_20845 [Pseudomonadota bacterium]|nr:hypothetical protein [Pseudomonadota bacterium]
MGKKSLADICRDGWPWVPTLALDGTYGLMAWADGKPTALIVVEKGMSAEVARRIARLHNEAREKETTNV